MPDIPSLLAAATAGPGERADAELLLLHVLRQPRSWLFAHADDVPGMDVQTAFSALLERRAAGEPVAYLTGRRGFWSLDLEVTPATLIPARKPSCWWSWRCGGCRPTSPAAWPTSAPAAA